MVEIRLFRSGDEQALYDICLRTGDGGSDASGKYLDPNLLGAIYVGPYLLLEPSLAFVGVDARGVAGYVLGAADTTAFDEACERLWWPELRNRYQPSTFPQDSPDARIVRLMHKPPQANEDVVERYPAHLHIDLLPRLQGHGTGRRMLETLLAALVEAGAPGVHLGVGKSNTRAIGFYERMGFTEVHTYPDSLIMARQLA